MSLRDASTLKTADVELILQHISHWYEILTWFIVVMCCAVLGRRSCEESVHAGGCMMEQEKMELLRIVMKDFGLFYLESSYKNV